VSADAVIQLHHRRHSALAEAGHRAYGEAAVRRGERELIGLLSFGVLVQPELQPNALQQAAGTARMARGAAAYGNCVLALRRLVEKRVKRDDAEDLRRRRVGFERNIP
jgi:hypothetical protein